MMRTIGANLRQAREAAGITQEELGRSLGSDADYVRGIEQGKVDPSATRFVQIAWALDVDPASLMSGLGSVDL